MTTAISEHVNNTIKIHLLLSESVTRTTVMFLTYHLLQMSGLGYLFMKT